MENLSKKVPYRNGHYDDVFGGAPRFGVPSLSPRMEDYAEIFGGRGSSRPATSIPVLDLPPVDGAGLPASFKGSTFDYFEVFGRSDGLDFAVTFDELMKPAVTYDSSDEAWTPAQSETLSDESESFACSDKNGSISNTELHHSSDGVKQFKVSYNKVFHTNEDDTVHGVSHVTQLNDVRGYSFLVREAPPQKMVVTNYLQHDDVSSGLGEEKQLRKTTSCNDKPFVSVSDISLRTQPSHLPPPSRPPPILGSKDGESGTQSSKINASRSFAFGETTMGDDPPMFYDVQVDASSSAAVSAAAMKDVMEKAQAKLKSAKHMKDRSKQAKICGETSERDFNGRGFADNATNHGKGYEVFQESSSKSEGNVEWKQDEEFFEVVETEDSRKFVDAEDGQRFGVHDLTNYKDKQEKRTTQTISHQADVDRKMKSGTAVHEKIIVEAVESDGFVNMAKVQKKENEDERRYGDEMRLKENAEQVKYDNRLNEAIERTKVEEDIMESSLGRDEKEEKEKQKSEKEALERDLEEKRLREAIEKEENEKRLRLALEEKEKREREAWERAEKEKREKEARKRELEERRLQEAIEKEEDEKRLRLALEEKEKQKREAWERAEKEKREKEARKRELEERRLQEAIEKEEDEKRVRLALEEKEKERRETLQREEKEKREKEAREREEKEKKIMEALQREEKEKREKEAREREEKENKIKEALQREEKEKREKEAREREEKERIEREASERAIKEMRLQKACEAEEKEKREQECRDREIEEKRLSEATEQEEKEKRFKVAFKKEESENVQSLASERDEPNNTVQKGENKEKAEEWCELEEDIGVPEVHGREDNEKRSSDEDFEHEELDKMWEENNWSDGNITFCEAANKTDKNNGETKKTKGPFPLQDPTPVEVQVQDLNSSCVARDGLQQKKRDIKVSEAMQDTVFDFDNKPLKKASSFVKQNVVNHPKKVQVGKDKKEENSTSSQEVKGKYPSQNAERKGKNLDDVLIREEKEVEEKKRLRKMEKEREREREREKDRMAVDKVSLERAAVERATEDARLRALAEARERLEKANAETKLRSERAAVERATAEAHERALQKATAGKATVERVEKMKQSSSRSGVGFTNGSSNAYSSVHGGVEVESPQRRKARLERHQRTAHRAAKALEEKNMRDLLAQRDLAERNRLAEGLDAEVKRWSSGKEGNLRALLSTLQYILGPNSGWQPIHLTEVITSAAVKRAYRKATLCVHPDKLQQRGASIHQKYICEKVFDLLKAAWNKFNSEER